MLPYEASLIHFEDVPGVRLAPSIPSKEVMRRLRNAIYAAGLKSDMKVTRDREGIRITIRSPILFDSGKADLNPEALPVLDELITILEQNPDTIVVEGHTDNVPISSVEFPSNWELSTARAISVARYLFEKGNMDPKRFNVAGYGEHHPVKTNETPDGRQENRRVEILLKSIERAEKEEEGET